MKNFKKMINIKFKDKKKLIYIKEKKCLNN